MPLQCGGFPAVYLSAVSDNFSTISYTICFSFDCCSLYLHMLCVLILPYQTRWRFLSALNCLILRVIPRFPCEYICNAMSVKTRVSYSSAVFSKT